MSRQQAYPLALTFLVLSFLLGCGDLDLLSERTGRIAQTGSGGHGGSLSSDAYRDAPSGAGGAGGGNGAAELPTRAAICSPPTGIVPGIYFERHKSCPADKLPCGQDCNPCEGQTDCTPPGMPYACSHDGACQAVRD